MAKELRRGPKKGKRLTPEIQAEMILETLTSKKTIGDVIGGYRKKGYYVKPSIENDLKNLGTMEIAFMLANKQILEEIREDAVKSIIKGIKKNK